MYKLTISVLFMLTALSSVSAQTTTEKLTGSWTELSKDGDPVEKKADWAFSADGKGFLSVHTKGTWIKCAIKAPFTYSIIGDSIKIVSGIADAECTLIGGDTGDAMSKSKEH